jgi:carboxymethylenebutenolidase
MPDVQTRSISVTSHDGGTFPAHLALPARTPAAGVLLLHEIFGVNDYITAVAERLALLGYVVLAPDLFWRIDPDHPLEQDEAGLAAAFERVPNLDLDEAVRDADAALAALSQLDEVNGSVGVVGFCLGGTLAFATALRSEPDAVVSYYGSGIPDLLPHAEAVHCPVLFVFGGEDAYIPAEVPDAVRNAFAGRDEIEVHVFPGAGHAFDNFRADLFHHPGASLAAWGLTADFLRRTVGTAPAAEHS